MIMDLKIDADSITLRLAHDEAMRLGIAIAAGYETISRAEYFIRTGLSEPIMRQISGVLTNSREASPGSERIPLTAGVEETENPRRPRP